MSILTPTHWKKARKVVNLFIIQCVNWDHPTIQPTIMSVSLDFFKDFLLCIPFKTCWDTLFSVAFDRPLL